MSASQDFVALDWIKGEIASTLEQAQQALEAVAESPDDSSSMRACLTHLHQVNGTLRMVNLEGPSALSAEMEELAESLMGQEVPDVARAQEVLMQAILQMPRYLDRIQREQRDEPSMVRPVVNSLRGARGEAPLGGSADDGDTGAEDGNRLAPLSVVVSAPVNEVYLAEQGPATAKKLRARYQQALSALLKKQNPRENLTLLAKVFTMLQKLCGESPMGNLSLLGLATVEGVASGAIKLNGSIAAQLKAFDGELKKLVEAGDEGLDAGVDVELGEALLDAVDGATKETARIIAARQKFAAIPSLVPEAEDVSFGPDDETIATVARILIEEITGITDKLDLYVRSADRNLQNLLDLSPQLKQVNGTLAVVGLNQHMDSVSQQIAAINAMADSGEDPSDEQLLDIAGALLEIESSLKALVGDEDEGEGEGFGSVGTAEATVIKETRNGLAACKDAVIEYVTADFNSGKVEGLPQRLAALRGGLQIINQHRSADVLTACADYVTGRMLGGGDHPSLEDMDDLADAITSIDYYLERYLESPGDPYLQMIEVAEQAITKLGYAPGAAVEAPAPELEEAPAADVEEEAVAAEPPLDATVRLDPVDVEETDAEAPAAELEEAPAAELEEAPAPELEEAPTADLDAEPSADPDVEPSADLDAEPSADLDAEPSADLDAEPSADLDAEPSADLDGEPSADLDGEPSAELDEAPAASFDDALADLEAEVPEEESLELDDLSLDETVPTPEAPAAPAVGPVEEVDEEILEIFIEEAAEVLETINEYLPRWQADPSDADALTEVRRAYHTLKGSGRMVGATVVGELAWSVENMLNRVIDQTIDASPALLALVGEVTARIPEGVDAFRRGEQNTFECADLEARADALIKGESPPVADTAEETSAFEIDEIEIEAPAAELEEAPAAAFDEESAGDLDAEPSAELDAEPSAELDAEPSAELDVEPSAELDVEPSAELDQAPSAEPEEAPSADLEFDIEADESPAVESGSDDVDITDLDAFEIEEVETSVDDIVTAEPVEDLALDDISFDADLDEQAAPESPSLEEDETAADGIAISEPDESTIPEPVTEPSVPEHDPELDEIFLAEAGERMVVVRDFCSQPAEVSADLVAAFHTLKGSAGMAEVATVSAVAGRLETLARNVFEQGGVPSAEFAQVVARGATLMEEILGDLSSYRAVHPGLDSYLLQVEAVDAVAGSIQGEAPPRFDFENIRLLSTADAVLDAWDAAEVSDLMQELREVLAQTESLDQPEVDALSRALLRVYERLGSRPTETVAAQLAQAHETLVAMFDAIAASQQVPDAGELPGQLDALDVDVHASPAGEEVEPGSAVATPAAGDAAAGDAVELPADEIDEDVLPLFLEEAEELVEEIDQSIVEWSADPSATEHLDNLLRQLHTLKGGSRMSGLASLGEFTHNFETFLIGVQHQDPSSFDEPFFALVNERQDEINRRVEIYRAYAAGTASAEDLESMRFDKPASAAADAGPTESAEPISEADVPSVSGDELAGDAAPSAESVVMAPSDESVALPEDEVDEDVLPIFLEEAEEIVEEIDQSILDWSNEPGAGEYLDNLLRQLHTLKGGSRMAGLASLGEFTHNLETWLIGIQSNPPTLDEAFFSLINQQQDEINRRVSIYRKMAAGEATEEELASMRSAAQPGTVAAARPAAETASAPAATAEEAPAPVQPEAPKAESKQPAAQQEMVRVASDLLEELISLAGESSITRGRIEQQIVDFGDSLQEMEDTISRIREQVRRLEIEAESRETVFRSRTDAGSDESFDDLELDRYTMIQEISRALNEGMSDMLDLRDTLVDKSRDAETLLHQQARIGSELQEGLTRTRMVPFARLIPRLRRIVRQISAEVGKSVRFDAYNVEGELDRTVLERIVAPLEHMLRNAVDHGIESTEKRIEAGKPEQGRISLRLDREGGYVVLKIGDDGGGINVEAVKAKAIERGLMTPDQQLSDHEIRQFIMNAGFSTAQKLTQISGRGVGMDVVVSEIKALGGDVEIDSTFGAGTEFTIRLPFTVSINRALMVVIQDEVFAIPLNTIEGIVRVSPYELEAYYQPDAPMFEYAGQPYRLSYMGKLLDKTGEPILEGQISPLPVILARSGDNAVALQVDRVIGSREVVVKSLGPQFNEVGGVSGATVLGDGSVVVILDVLALVRSAELAAAELEKPEEEPAAAVPDTGVRTVMIVDDSVTVRKVTSRLMERQGWEVSTAKDGLDAMNQLQETMPDIMLLDIEMPKMDGFEVLGAVRRDERLKDLPIIMITSRTGEKHKQRALDLGVNRYLGKPFQEANLMSTIDDVLAEVNQ